MKNLIKHKVFIAAFLMAYFLFFVITIYVLNLKTGGIGAGSIDYGFPFIYYSSNCYGGSYLWSGLIGNILVAAIISFVTGLVSTHFRIKFSSPEFRAKWYL